VTRRKKGSHRRLKAVALLAKAHQKVHRQRTDFHHKVTRQIIQQNDTIYHEALQVANMVKNPHLAKSISDAGWAAFLSLQKKGENAPSVMAGMKRPLCSLTNSGSSEYAVFSCVLLWWWERRWPAPDKQTTT
jgi:hypothetical protein